MLAVQLNPQRRRVCPHALGHERDVNGDVGMFQSRHEDAGSIGWNRRTWTGRVVTNPFPPQKPRHFCGAKVNLNWAQDAVRRRVDHEVESSVAAELIISQKRLSKLQVLQPWMTEVTLRHHDPVVCPQAVLGACEVFSQVGDAMNL